MSARVEHPLRRNWGRRGVVLIVVVWVLALLSALVVEFDLAMRVEAEGTGNFKEELKAYYLARAGVEMGIAEAMNDYGPAYAGDSGEIVYTRGLAEEGEEEVGVSEAFWHRRAVEFAGGEVSYALYDEEGRYNINSLRDTKVWILSRLLGVGGGVEVGSERDTIIDSALDWKDRNSLMMLNGAEEDYYQSLPMPYHCKNGDLYVPEEVLYVKGMTREIFYGGRPAMEEIEGDTSPGIKDFVTTFSSRRGGGEYEFHVATARPELREIMGLRPEIRATANPTLIRIVARGSVNEGRIVRTVEAVVRVRPGQKSWEVVFWDENSTSKLPEYEEGESI